MTKSMLTSVRNAFSGQASIDDPETGERGDDESPTLTSQNRSKTMSETNSAPAANNLSGTTQAASDVDIAAARAEGVVAGATAANTRLNAVMSADGIKGEGPRMSAALDLAVKSPEMSAEDVSAFVTANVAASGSSAAEFEAGRVTNTASLASPQGAPKKSAKQAGLSRAEIFAKRRANGA